MLYGRQLIFFFFSFQVLSIINSIMPRPLLVSDEDSIAVIKRYMSYFCSDTLPAYSAEVWSKMSKEPEFVGKWNTAAVRTNIKDNRRGILTRARKECGYFSQIIKKKFTYSNNDDDDNDSNDNNDNDDSDDNSDKDYFNKLYAKERDDVPCFHVEIARGVWECMYKKDNSCKNPRLQPKVWTDTIAFELWHQFELPCAFVFKKGTIHENGNYYATFIGKCKSKVCNNPIFGYIENNPGDKGSVFINFRCRDTRFEVHDEVTRPLQAERRKMFKTMIDANGVKGTILEQAKDLLKPGSTQCPVLFNSNVLYQVKKESKEEKLNVKPEDRRDLIKAIYRINEDDNPAHQNFIKVVIDTPFSVFYVSPQQIHCYNEYRRLHRHYSSVCIDATGGLAKKFLDSKNKTTSSIFLYQIVINFSNTSQSVYQILSEIHDTKTIKFGLENWLSKVSPPTEVVCDGSRVLLNASCLACNNFSLFDYVNRCFQHVKNGASLDSVKTFIRLDTAHFIHAISGWKCWKSVIHPRIKSFYLYSVALLMDCNNLKDFERILVLILIVCGTEYDDSIVDFDGEMITTKAARSELEKLIAKNESQDFINNIEDKIKTMEFDQEKNETLRRETNTDLLEKDTTISSWINNLVAFSLNVHSDGSNDINNLNTFYVPLFKDSLLKEVREFPLWTKVCIHYTSLRATSAYIEQAFKELKELLGKMISLPARVDYLVKAHLKLIDGGVKIFERELLKFVKNYHANKQKNDKINSNPEDELCKEDCEPNDNLLNENWNGQGYDMKHNDCDWLDSDCHLFNEDIPTNFNTESFNSSEIDNNNVLDNIDCSANENNENLYQPNLNNLVNLDHSYCSDNNSPLNENSFDAAVEKNLRMIKKEGKYFKSFPEINLINNLAPSNKKEEFLLQNGNKSGPVFFQNESWFAFNTCPFDSIVQLIFYGCLQNEEFNNFVSNSSNSTFNFVTDFMSTGLKKDIYVKRFSILHPIYQDTECTQNQMNIANRKTKNVNRCINCVDNVNSLWIKLFTSEPSAFENNSCSSFGCQDYQRNIPVLTANYNLIMEKGFKCLQEALHFKSIAYNKFCTSCQKKQTTCKTTLNRYIYIELDVKSVNEKDGTSCKLGELPKCLDLNETHSSKKFSYRLVHLYYI